MSSVSNGLYLLTLPLVSIMRVIYRKIRHARYLYIKRNVEKVWGARYILGARYLSRKSLGCALSIEKYGTNSVASCLTFSSFSFAKFRPAEVSWLHENVFQTNRFFALNTEFYSLAFNSVLRTSTKFNVHWKTAATPQ